MIERCYYMQSRVDLGVAETLPLWGINCTILLRSSAVTTAVTQNHGDGRRSRHTSRTRGIRGDRESVFSPAARGIMQWVATSSRMRSTYSTA